MIATPTPATTASASALASLANDPTVQKLLGTMAGLRRKLSRRVLLVDFSDNSALVAQCRLRRNSVDLLPIDLSVLPEEALEKGCPTEPEEMAALLKEVIQERKIVAQRAAVVLPSIAFTTMSLCMQSELSTEDALQELGEPGSGVQLPFPRQQADMALLEVTDPEARRQHRHRSYLLMAVQRSITDRLVATFKGAGLELQFVDSGLVAPLRLLDSDIEGLGGQEQLLHLHLAPGFTSCTVVWRGGPQKQQRLAPVRAFPLLQEEGSDDYFPVTPEDLLSLLRDLRKLIKESENRTSLITLGGTGSGHPGIDELLSDALELPVKLLRPLQHPAVGHFELPSGVNPQALSRIVGMAVRCLRTEQNATKLVRQAAKEQRRQDKTKPSGKAKKKNTSKNKANSELLHWLHCLKARIKSNIGR